MKIECTEEKVKEEEALHFDGRKSLDTYDHRFEKETPPSLVSVGGTLMSDCMPMQR